MTLFLDHETVTHREAAALLGCPAASAEHRLEQLQQHGLARWNSAGSDGRRFHLTFVGKDWLHRRGLLP